MASYLARRLVYMVVVLALVSVVSFYIINLPPGSWVETYAIQLDSAGSPASAAQLAYITERYGLDRPLFEQYVRWIVPILSSGDFGFSFEWQQPVSALIGDRLLLTIVVSLASLIFVYAVSIRDRAAFGDAPVFALRLSLFAPRHHRTGDAELPARPRVARHLGARLRRDADGPVLAGISRPRPGPSTSGSI